MSKCRCSSGPPRSPRRPEPLLEPGRVDRVPALVSQAGPSRGTRDANARLAERGQGHHLVFVGRVQEAEVGRDLLVEDPQRVGHLDLAEPFQIGPLPDGVAGRRLLAAAVERQDGGPLERRGVEGAGGVRQVMRHEMPAEGARRARTPRNRACKWCGAPSSELAAGH